MLSLSRLYTWSVIFDPLLFFILAGPGLIGIPVSVARILQVLVLAGLVIKTVNNVVCTNAVKVRIFNVTNPLYVNFSIFFILLVIAGGIGFFTGAYDLLPYSDLQDQEVT